MIELADAKAHLNITTSDDDMLIQGKIDAATAFINLYTGASDSDVAPAPVMEACRQLVAHLYGNREATIIGATAQTMPLGMLDLLSAYRAYAF